MTSNVVPLDAIAVLVVEHRQAGLVVELLQPLDGDADVVLGLDGPLLDSLVIVRLRNSSLSCGRPGSFWMRGVCRRNPAVASSRPEPAVHVDRLQMGTVAALVLEVAFPTRGVDRGDVV